MTDHMILFTFDKIHIFFQMFISCELKLKASKTINTENIIQGPKLLSQNASVDVVVFLIQNYIRAVPFKMTLGVWAGSHLKCRGVWGPEEIKILLGGGI